MDHVFWVFIEFVAILLLFYVLVFWPQNMWDLRSLTRDQIHTPLIGRRSLNHWTTREIPTLSLTSHRDLKPTKTKTVVSASLLASTLTPPSIQLSCWKPGNHSGLFLFLVYPSRICLLLFLSSLLVFVIYCMSQCTYLLSLTLIQSYSNLSFTRIRGIFLNIKLFMSVPWLKVCPSAPVTSSWKLKATLRSFDSHVLAPNSCQPLHSHFPSFLPLNLMFYPQETDYDSLNLPDSHLPLLTCFSLCLEGSTSLFQSQDFSTWLTFFLAWAN